LGEKIKEKKIRGKEGKGKRKREEKGRKKGRYYYIIYNFC